MFITASLPDTSASDTVLTSPELAASSMASWSRSCEIEKARGEESNIMTRSQTKAMRDRIAGLRDPSKFVYFNQLPIEIRHRIWELSRVARFLKLYEDRQTSTLFHPSIPSILHACSESRYVGLKHYRLAFGTTPLSCSSRARVWFDFSIDGLILNCSEADHCPAHRMWWPRVNGDTCADRDLVQRIVWEGPLSFQPMGSIASMFKNCVEAKIIRTTSPAFQEDVMYVDDFAVTEEELWMLQGMRSVTDYWLKKKKQGEDSGRGSNMLGKVERVKVISRRVGVDGKRVMETDGGERVEIINGRMVVSGTIKFGPLSEKEMKLAEEYGTSKWEDASRHAKNSK